jgi:hypothetical protein
MYALSMPRFKPIALYFQQITIGPNLIPLSLQRTKSQG